MKTSENDAQYSNFINIQDMIYSESCTLEREITPADLKEKQWHGNTLYKLSFSSQNLRIFSVVLLIDWPPVMVKLAGYLVLTGIISFGLA